MVGAIGLVTRKSTRDEAKVSVTRQEEMGREWAATNHPDLPVVVFSDNATSGVNMERPGWLAFVDAVRSGRIAHVWAYEQSRLTRAGVASWEQVCELLCAAGITHVNTNRQGQISVVEGNRIVGDINSVMDKHEREQVRVRTRDGMARSALEGRPTGVTGYGYTRTYDTTGRPELVPDPTEAPLVARMVRAVAEGQSLGMVAAELNEDGIPTPRGSKQWRRETVRAIVTAPRIVGERVHQGKVVGPAKWPAIVDRDLWNQAQAALRSPEVGTRRVRRTLTGGRRRYLLTGGLTLCANCDTPLIAHRYTLKGTHEPGYACPHPSRHDGGCGRCAILARHLEPHVISVVGGWVDDPTFVDAVNRHLAAGADDATPVRAELAEVEQRLVTLAEEWASGDKLEMEYVAERRVLLDRRRIALDRLAELPAEDAISGDQIREAWHAAVRRDDTDAMRAVIGVLAKPIRVERANRDGRRLTAEQRAPVDPVWD